MRARAVVITLLVATLITPELSGWSTARPTHSSQIQSDPIPPHRFFAAPIDAAVLDIAPVSKRSNVVHKSSVVVKKKVTHISKVLPTGPWSQGNWSRFPASVEISARCIAHHESWHAGLWRAKNGVSSASGFGQWLDGIWRVQAKRAGVGTQYARAYLAPPDVQASVFAYQAMHYGLYPWHGTNCPGT